MVPAPVVGVNLLDRNGLILLLELGFTRFIEDSDFVCQRERIAE